MRKGTKTARCGFALVGACLVRAIQIQVTTRLVFVMADTASRWVMCEQSAPRQRRSAIEPATARRLAASKLSSQYCAGRPTIGTDQHSVWANAGDIRRHQAYRAGAGAPGHAVVSDSASS